MGYVGASWGILGHLGVSWGILGCLRTAWQHLGASCSCLGGVLGRLGASWRCLGGILGRLGSDLEACTQRLGGVFEDLGCVSKGFEGSQNRLNVDQKMRSTWEGILTLNFYRFWLILGAKLGSNIDSKPIRTGIEKENKFNR